MRLFDRIKGLFGVSFGSGRGDGSGYGSPVTAREWALGLPDTEAAAVIDPYATHPTVAIAIRTIAEDAAAVDWEIYEAGADEDDDPLEEHPLLDLWSRPNPQMSGSDLWIASYTQFRVFGECWWYYPDLRLGGNGATRATRKPMGGIEIIDPREVLVKTDRDEPTFWRKTTSGEYEPLDGDRLTQFRRYNPYNPWRGLSELAALEDELVVDVNASRWNLQFFGNQNGVPTGLLKPSADNLVPTQDRDDYLSRFNGRHSRNRAVGILPPGWDFEKIGGSPNDMEFGLLREYAREQTLAMFGVPPFLAGVLDKANYANAREQKGVYWNGTITRMLEYFQGVLNYDFLPKIGVEGIEVYPCYEKVKALTDNLVEKVQIASTLFNLGFTKRQLNDRLELGLDVDDLEDADVGYLPLSMLPVTMVEEAHTPVAPAPPAEPNEDEDEQPPREAAKGILRSKEGRRTNLWRSIMARTRDVEVRFSKIVRSHFQSIEVEVQGTLAGLKGWNLLHGVEKAEESNLFDIQQAKKRLMIATAPVYSATIRRGADSVMAEISVAVEFNAVDPRVTAKLAELTAKITRIDDTVERALREQMIEGILEGESIPDLAKRVTQTMDAAKSRAMTIARTETGNAFNSGRVAGMEQAGVSKHEWLTARDSSVRDSHQLLDGQVVAIGDAFSNGLRYPCDSSATDPAEIINCRCTVLPVVGGSDE